ncbi:MAG: trypsin-like peptidase domain-containing protein [Dehalococcoidia bacterium]|nr:trypsin-like peptidase domain-containing protein [Dehalococcoidia bacterium]MDW8008599.1 trypsin-like peptidase domain-containing protein [Chloroflexota bacterium]
MVAAKGMGLALAALLALATACAGQNAPLLIGLDVTPTVPPPSPTVIPAPSPTPACNDPAAGRAAAAPATVQVVAGTTAGSGVAVAPHGRVVTAYRLVRDHVLVSLLLPDGRKAVGQVVAWDEASDLALVAAMLDGLPTVRWAPAEPVPGDQLLALGYPFPSQHGLGGQPTVTAAVARRPVEASGQKYISLGTDLNEGYSGGPVVDLCGRLVGLVLARLGDGGEAALSLASARPIVERLAATPTPSLGPEESALAANMATVLREGYLPSGRYAAVTAASERFYGLHGICLDSPDSYCQKVLFFLGTRYLGADTQRPSRLVLDVTPGERPGEVVVIYASYAPGDPDCCPTGQPVPIPYYWDGQRLRPGGVPPGH